MWTNVLYHTQIFTVGNGAKRANKHNNLQILNGEISIFVLPSHKMGFCMLKLKTLLIMHNPI